MNKSKAKVASNAAALAATLTADIERDQVLRCLLRFRQFRPLVTARAHLLASESLIAVPIFFFCTMWSLTAISLCR